VANMSQPKASPVNQNTPNSNLHEPNLAPLGAHHSNASINRGMPSRGDPQTSTPQAPSESLPRCIPISEEFLAPIRELVKQRRGVNAAPIFQGHIRDPADLSKYERAVDLANWNYKIPEDIQDRTQGYPTTPEGRLELVRRIFDAFFNLDGKQDKVAEKENDDKCYAVNVVTEKTAPIEVEIVAHKLIVSLS
jgi:hypothetical protein